MARYTNFATSLGASLGTGLGGLIEQKVADVNRQKTVNRYINAGYNPQVADLLVHWEQQHPQQFHNVLGQVGTPSAQSGSAAENTPQILNAEDKKRMHEQQLLNRKEAQEFRHKLIESKKESRATLKDLDRLEELSQSGKLATPGYVEFLKRAGLDIPALTNPESEEFQKIQQGFLKNAKQYFGGRVSNYEVEQFLRTIPSLSQSPEGRQRVIAGLKRVARASDEYYKAYEDVLRKNNGIPPYNIEEQVEKEVEQRLDHIYEQFKKDLSKPVPKGQNKLITALQSVAGNAVGGVGGIVKTGLGAAAGLKGLSAVKGFI